MDRDRGRLAGVVALGAGAYLGLEARGLEDKVTTATTFNPSDNQAGEHARTFQFVMYGVGGAALVAGGILYWLGLEPERHGVALVPVVSPHGSGVALRGRL